MNDKWRGILSKVAPGLATVLGGPLAGGAVKILSDTLLGHPNGTEDDVALALSNATPDQLAAVRKADQDYSAKMRELDIDVLKIDQLDRVSARERETKAADSWTPRILAALVVVSWAAVQWTLLHHIIDQSMRELVARMLGTLDAALMAVLYYYFGSSSGSAAKTAALAASKPAKDPD